MEIKIEWLQRIEMRPVLLHARAVGSHYTLCMLSVPAGARSPPEGKVYHCTQCEQLEKKIGTPEGELIFETFGRLDVPSECWELAERVIKQRSLLATQLAAATARVDALYPPRRDPLDDPGQASPL